MSCEWPEREERSCDMGWKLIELSGEEDGAEAAVLLSARRSLSNRRRSPSNEVWADFAGHGDD